MVTRGLHVPPGWYLLERSVGGRGRHLRLGMYCSLSCLLAAGEELRVGESEHADRLGLAADPDRDRRRLLERAETLLHSGHTIRQAAEVLGLPVGGLRTWLRAAGIRVGAEGTLGPAGTAVAGTRPDPGSPEGHSPVGTLYEMTQAGRLRDLRFALDSTGPDHDPTFTATASALLITEEVTGVPGSHQSDLPGRPIAGRGSGPSKTTAKTAAATDLLATLRPGTT